MCEACLLTLEPSTSVTEPATLYTFPTATWPGMMGYGTMSRRPCCRWTSVPQTSLNTISNTTEPGAIGASFKESLVITSTVPSEFINTQVFLMDGLTLPFSCTSRTNSDFLRTCVKKRATVGIEYLFVVFKWENYSTIINFERDRTLKNVSKCR
jgi:hypothetical protein